MNKIKSFKKLREDQRGIMLLTVLMIAMLLTFIGMSMTDYVVAQLYRTNTSIYASNALMTAEAGLEQSLYALNEDVSFGGYASEVELFNDEVQGRGTYSSEVTGGTGPNEKIIIGTSRIYKYGSSEVVSERKVRITVVGTSSPGYSVQAGAGGLILSGSANITNSEVYVNGYIQMSGAAKIGTPSQPSNVFVANQQCPTGSNPGPTYPHVCGSGVEPISFGVSNRIYGPVCATGQINDRVASWQTDPSIQNLQPGCVAPTAPMPTYDRPAHISRMTTTGLPSNIEYNCSSWKNPEGFVRTWPANLRLNGNVNLSSSCDLTITGDVYITGNLNIGGAARIRIADSLGTTRPVIVVDGDIDVGGSASLIPNSSGTSAHFISFKSSGACSPNCTEVQGTNLKNSQNLLTVDVAGAGNFPGTIFHAYWSKVKLGGAGNVGSAIGQTIDLSGAGTITFGTTLSSGESTWTVRSYQYVFD